MVPAGSEGCDLVDTDSAASAHSCRCEHRASRRSTPLASGLIAVRCRSETSSSPSVSCPGSIPSGDAPSMATTSYALRTPLGLVAAVNTAVTTGVCPGRKRSPSKAPGTTTPSAGFITGSFAPHASPDTGVGWRTLSARDAARRADAKRSEFWSGTRPRGAYSLANLTRSARAASTEGVSIGAGVAAEVSPAVDGAAAAAPTRACVVAPSSTRPPSVAIDPSRLGESTSSVRSINSTFDAGGSSFGSSLGAGVACAAHSAMLNGPASAISARISSAALF